jgi:hypothetical protein
VNVAAEVPTTTLFSAWEVWRFEQGHCDRYTNSGATFGSDLMAAFPAITKPRPRIKGSKTEERAYVYRGLKLNPEYEVKAKQGVDFSKKY